MKAKRHPVLLVLIAVFVALLAGCSSDDDTGRATGGRLDTVKDRGNLVIAGRTDMAGFGFLDASGNNAGFDIDLGRAVAAAIFGNGDAIEVVPITAAERGPTIQGGEVDILIRNTTWTTNTMGTTKCFVHI